MEHVFMKGCEAISEAAIRAGCRFFSGYPITPQNEVPEYMSRRLPEVGGTFVQGESELAAVNMVYGAAATGTYAMTSSSSPGISLKTEGISYLASSHIPAVIMNVQRAGPGIGRITAAQSDYFQAVKAPGHGGFRCIVYTPATLQESVDVMYMAFQKAWRDRNPVIVLIDGCLGAIMEAVDLPEMKPLPNRDDMDWALSGCRDRNHRLLAPITYDIPAYNEQMTAVYQAWQKNDVMVEESYLEDAEIVLTGYGTAARIAKSVMTALRRQGHRIGMIRPITVSPFPAQSFEKLVPGETKLVINIEMTMPAQMVEDVRLSLNGRIPVETVEIPGGIVPTDDDILEGVLAAMERGKG